MTTLAIVLLLSPSALREAPVALSYAGSQTLPEVIVDGRPAAIHTQGLFVTATHFYVTGRLERSDRRSLFLAFNRDAPDRYDVVSFEAEPGDLIVHDWRTIHGSAGNISPDRIRRADSVRLAGDDVTFYLRPSSPEPFRYTVELNDGDDLDGSDRFPRLYG